MVWPEWSIRIACVFTLFLSLTLSGCGTIGGIIVGSVLSSQELREDDTLCTKRCGELKGNDYAVCHKACMLEQRRMRSERKDEYQHDLEQWNRRVAEERLKTPQK
jgi:hypothetical protein